MVTKWFGNEANKEVKKQRQEKSKITDWCIFLIALDCLKYIFHIYRHLSCSVIYG